MADYFLLLDADAFEGRTRPALAESWRRRNFEPCRELCAALMPAARAFAERYHVGGAEPLLFRVAAGGLSFDRTFWRGLAGEVLLFSAAALPEIQTAEEALCRLLAPDGPAPDGTARRLLPPVRQAHRGSRDLTFGAAVYRPEHAGYNDAADVARLADDLAAVDPAAWTASSLAGLPGVETEEERADELEFARDWFPPLADLYRQARDARQVVVVERIY
jgi:hypothetical protein